MEITKTVGKNGAFISIDKPKIDPTVVILEDIYKIKPLISTDGSPITGTTYEEMIEHTMLYIGQD